MNVDRSFPRHPLPSPAPEVIDAAKMLRDLFRQWATTLDITLKDSREKSLALTHLEDASTYASKAIYADGPAAIDTKER